jgi:hypothetical protein
MKYNLLNQDDCIINQIELGNNILTKKVSIQNNCKINQIELENSILINKDSIQDNCSICLDVNDNSSIKLECNCGNKFHSKCIKKLKEMNFENCPLCKKKIFNFNKKIFTQILEIIFFIFFLLYLNTFGIGVISTTIINPIFYILTPSELKYCDNNYKKCEYYPIKAILSNNTINEKYNNFNIKYELLSSYKYIDYNTKQNKTCINLESHEFITYHEALIISKKNIGIEKNIFVPFDEKKNCKLYYKFYNKIKFILNQITFLNLILIIPTLLSFGILASYMEDIRNNNNISLKKKIFIVWSIIEVIIFFIIQFTYAFYYWKLYIQLF